MHIFFNLRATCVFGLRTLRPQSSLSRQQAAASVLRLAAAMPGCAHLCAALHWITQVAFAPLNVPLGHQNWSSSSAEFFMASKSCFAVLFVNVVPALNSVCNSLSPALKCKSLPGMHSNKSAMRSYGASASALAPSVKIDLSTLLAKVWTSPWSINVNAAILSSGPSFGL